MNDVPPTEAELAAAAEDNVFVQWERRQPKPKPKRKLDIPQLNINEQIAIAIEEHKALVMAVMAQVVGEIQQRFNRKLENLKSEVAGLRTELQIEKRVNERMMQVDQRHNQQRVNGHANGHA
jgi:hypothetical protein